MLWLKRTSTKSLQIELVTKYDINDGQKESFVGEFKPTKEGPYPPADMDWEGGGGVQIREGSKYTVTPAQNVLDFW